MRLLEGLGGRHASCLLALVGLILAGLTAASCGYRSMEAKANAATAREAKAATQAAHARQIADERGAEVARLRAALDALPRDPGARPVPADTPAPVVVEQLQGLGLHPTLLADGLGLSLADSSTALHWGYEAQRVGPLVARLDASIALTRAQEGQSSALLQQADHLTSAADAADRRAALSDRPWFGGAAIGLDTAGRRRLGGFVGRNSGVMVLQVGVMGDTAFVGGGVRW